MNSQDGVVVFLHWFWVAFFVAFGAFLIGQRRNVGSVRRICGNLRVASADNPSDLDRRIRAAIARREDAEGTPAPIGIWMGTVSLALAVAAAFTPVADGLLYAVLCFAFALTSAAVFLRLRNTQRMRVAVLAARTPDQVIPPFWFVLSSVSALSVLALLWNPQWSTAAVLVCASSLLTTLVAWRLTKLGAMLSGEDIPAEQFVDDRIRAFRSSLALMFAFVQPFVLQTQVIGAATLAEFAGRMLSWIVWMAFLVWVLRWQRRTVRLA